MSQPRTSTDFLYRESRLIVDLTTSVPFVPVLVVNSSTHKGPVQVTLSFAGPAAQYLSWADRHPTPLPPGIKGLRVKISPDAIASTGTLILTASDGSVDREPIHLVGARPPAAGPPGTLIPGTFDVLLVHATSFVPSFFRPLPSTEKWGAFGFLSLVLAITLSFAYRAARDRKSVSCTILIGIGLIGAVLGSLVFLGGWAAALIHGNVHQAVAVKTWSVAPPAPGRIDADLIGDNGQIGGMVVTGSTLTISDVPSAGIYTGVVVTQPVTGTGVIKATLIVRDWWVYAFATVLLGVVLGLVISRFYQQRPTRQLEADAADMSAMIVRHESDWCARSVRQAWGEPYTFAGFAQTAASRILSSAASDSTAAAAALATFSDLDMAMEALRDQVAILGEQHGKLCARFAMVVADSSALSDPGWLAPLTEPLNLAGRTLTQAQTVIEDRRELIPGVQGAAKAGVRAAARLDEQAACIDRVADEQKAHLYSLWVNLIQSVLAARDKDAIEALGGQIDALEQDVSASPPAEEDLTATPYSGRRSPLPEAFQVYVRTRAGQIAQLGAPSAGPDQASRASVPANRDTLIPVTVTVAGLTAGTNVHWEFSDGSRSATFPGPDRATRLSIMHCFTSGPEMAYAEVIGEDRRPVSTRWLGHVSSLSAAQRLRAALGADDRIVAMVAAVLAVGSGMAALYLNAPAWGSAGDYVAALLWGSVTSEGIKLIVNVIGKRWPIAA